jgi:hypothetical protein
MSPAVGIILLFVLVALFLDWRKGLYFAILTGFLQDPIRKVIEGAPIIMTLLSSVVLIIIFVKLNMRRIKAVNILTLYPNLRSPLLFFVIVIILQCLHAYINTSNIMVAAIGIIAYFSPIPAVVLGYEFARSFEDMRKIIVLYVAMTVLYMVSIWIEWYGVDWKALGSFGKEWTVFYGELSIKMLSGLFRSPEIAAWHGATAGIFAFALSFGRDRKLEKRHILFFLICFVTLFLTGRRKGIGTMLIFGGIYTSSLFLFELSGKKRFTMIVLMIAVLFLGAYFVSDATPEPSTANLISPYFLRGQSTFHAAPTRLNNVLDNIAYTWREAGILGVGAGYFSQGTQYTLEYETKTAKYTEVGVAKILGELGLPGVFVLIWFGMTWYKSLQTKLGAVLSQEGKRNAALLLSLLLANVTSFFFSATAFGDPFVLTMMGMIIGMLMAIPKIEFSRPNPQTRRQGDVKLYA